MILRENTEKILKVEISGKVDRRVQNFPGIGLASFWDSREAANVSCSVPISAYELSGFGN